MGKGFYADLESIRQENTQYAVFHINKTPELLNMYLELKNEKMSVGAKYVRALEIALDWATDNKEQFGDLFITELELVRWSKLLQLL